MPAKPEVRYRVPEALLPPSAYGISERVAEEARNRFYPGHWTYRNLGSPPEKLRPFYINRVSNLRDALLAEAVKPPHIRAEIILT